MNNNFQVSGTNASALFTLKLHRGDGMTLIAMNWKSGKPPKDFVGFAIEYKEPKGEKFYPLNNRLAFPDTKGGVNPNKMSTRFSPIQKFRWVHFPRNAELEGKFTYRVTPVFMDSFDKLSYGESQEALIQLMRETYPGQLNVTFTRGFVSSQAFVERYESAGPISALLPEKADDGLKFVPTHPKAKEALEWMGFEARNAILEVLDNAIADKKAQVRVVAYDLSEPGIVTRLQKLGSRLKVIIDDDGPHKKTTSGETQAEKLLKKSAGKDNVKRQHVGKLQHNKTIAVDGPKVKTVVCGSTNYTWRGFYVQSNNAMIIQGKNAVKIFFDAFDNYWEKGTPPKFGNSDSAVWNDLNINNVNAKITFSPHAEANAQLQLIADDIGMKTTSCLFYSLAFLYQTNGALRDAITKITKDKNIFVYGISDKKVGGIELQEPDGNIAPVYPTALNSKKLPEPFRAESSGGKGTRLHHKFLVVDFDKPTARVYLGSYNFSPTADNKNGENLLLIKDRRIAVSYMIEALRIIDHYHFRVLQMDAKKTRKKLQLAKPPRKTGEKPWWSEDYANAMKIRDRKLFA